MKIGTLVDGNCVIIKIKLVKNFAMLFCITAIDKDNSVALRLATREAHLAYGRESGCIRLGGPFLNSDGDMVGSMMIIEAADLQAAKEFHSNDPYLKAGLFAHSEVRPWKLTFNGCDAKF